MDRELPPSANGRPTPKKPHSKPNPQTPKVADPLLAAYDELNTAWNEAEADFAAMRVPVRVSHQVSRCGLGHPDGPEESEQTVSLEWTRHQNQWRICWVKRTQRYGDDWWEEDDKPVAECPMDIRVKMADHLGNLRRKMKEARANYLPQVIDAIAEIRKALTD
jgi:hypothetical protein